MVYFQYFKRVFSGFGFIPVRWCLVVSGKFVGIAPMANKSAGFGPYPETSLAQARTARDEAARILNDGTDTSEQRKTNRLIRQNLNAVTFDLVAAELSEIGLRYGSRFSKRYRDMFFLISKILWFIAAPSNFFGLFLVASLLFFRGLLRRVGLVSATMFYLACAMGPAGNWLMRPLEDRFSAPQPDMIAPDGIIVLGGSLQDEISAARGGVTLGESGTRMTEFVALARRFPRARLVFSGGSGNLVGFASNEADTARRLLDALGIDSLRMTYEDKSRNTWENAVFSADMLQPKADEHWLLVTSAFHMPRAMGVFRKAGFNVLPWPAGYMTTGLPEDGWRPNIEASIGLRTIDTAAREWIGLAAYHLTGRTDDWLPR
eukprot:gene11094-11175_t